MNYLLFTTSTCPKCPGFKDFVYRNLHCEGQVIDSKEEIFTTLSKEYMVNSVPTLIVFEDDTRDAALLRTSDLSEVYEFIHSH